MKVLVTGGTGFVGREILRELHGAGHQIRLLARNPNSPAVQKLTADFGAEVHAGSVLDAASLEKSGDGADAVIHLVGIISEVGRQTYENVHTLGTQNIVAAAQRAGVKRFVQMSALGTRANAVARYHQSKWAAEEIVRASALDWTIFRPSIIYGPGDGFVNLFARLARWSPFVPVMGDGESKFQPVPVENVARSFVRALDEPKAVGRTFDLCGDEVFTLNEIIDAILAATGRRRWKLHLPLSLAIFQAALLELIFGKILLQTPPLNRDQLRMLQEDNVGEASPARELFHLPPVKFAAGIAKYL